MAKVFLDCTPTFYSEKNTGIQRTVRNIVNNSFDIKDEIIPVFYLHQGYHAILQPIFCKRSVIKSKINASLKFLYIYIRQKILPFFPLVVKKKLFTPNIAMKFQRWINFRWCFINNQKNPLVKFSKGDILILIDETWQHNNYKEFKKLKEIGVKIVVLIYDLIPLTDSKYCSYELSEALKDWYEKAPKYIDKYIAISKYVKKELFTYLSKSPDYLQSKSFDFCYLSGNFSKTRGKGIRVDESFKKIFSKKVFLTVSTLEARKNHQYALDAFELLWEKEMEVIYLIIGSKGRDSKKLVDRILSHQEYSKKLYYFESIEDQTLIYAYSNCEAVISPSIVEGFGLPIVEAFCFNKNVLASDIPIYREVGGDSVSYFDLSNPSSLARLIIHFEQKLINKSNIYTKRSWKDMTIELIKKSKNND